MKKRVLITAGGTGGHIYPAVALASQLQKKIPEIELLFVGGKLSTNRYFQGQPYNHHEVSCGKWSSKNPLKLLKSLIQIVRGVWQSRRIIKKYQPDLIVGFGSYHTFPTLFAAKLSKKPIILHEANSIPGKVNRLLSRHVAVTGVHFPETAAMLHGPAVEVGLPLREQFTLSSATKQEARTYFGLDSQAIVILVFGGSQGAKAINTILSEALTKHFPKSSESIQILHFSGDPEQTKYLEQLYAAAGIKAYVKEHEQKMNLAWIAADMVIARAGASTIAEQMEFEVPGILIPFPQAADNHQGINADFMVRVGGAIKFIQADLTSEKLAQMIKNFLKSDCAQLKEMRKAIQLYGKRSKRIDLCSLVCELLEAEDRS